MSVAELCAWAVWRSLIVALPAVALAWMMRPLVARLHSGRAARVRWAVLWALLLAPLLMPTLLTAYAYREPALSWVREPDRVEWLYRAMLLARYAPVAVLVLLLAPRPPVSLPAMHAAKLCGRRLPVGFLARGPLRSALVAFVAVFLLCFVEFEVASLLDVRTWTVWLFEAHSMRVPLGEMARYAAGPLACQLLVLTPILFLLIRGRRSRESAPPHAMPHPLAQSAAWLYLTAAAMLGCVYPLGKVAAGAWRGSAQLLKQDWMLEQTAYGLRQAIIPAVTATGIALILRRFSRGPVALLACLPGMFGPLAVALGVLGLFQWSALRGQYDTLWPLALAHTLWLLPIALLLVVLLGPARPASTHLALLLWNSDSPPVRRASRRLLTRAWVSPMVAVAFVLFCFAYFELTATAMLAPAGQMPATVAAYNNMHYGQYDVLSARVLLNFLTVALVVLISAAAARIALRA